MSGNDFLSMRFPDMKPIRSVPSLSTINGIGFSMIGARNHDIETGSYIKTHCFSVVFIPFFAIGAYRVVDAQPSGWYFLGKVPLSNFARFWNMLFTLALVLVGAGFWWHHHANHPETIAAHRIEEADALAAEGKIGAAAGKYQQVAVQHNLTASRTALDKLCQLFKAPLAPTDPPELITAFTVGVDSVKVNQRPDNLVEIGLEQARTRAPQDPKTAWKLLEIIASLAPRDPRLTAVKEPILTKLAEQEPDNLDVISDLAVVYENDKRLEAAEKLLTPKREQLGPREGARILGQILVSRGKFEEALPLLESYAGDRLKQLAALEANVKNTIKQVDDRVIAELQAGKAPGFDFSRYKSLKDNHNAQDVMVQEYLNQQLRNNADFKRAQDALQSASRVVPVALDLGIALLRRGQTLADPDARRKELEKAEQTFLSVKGVAGQTDEFRMFLGQVYYWLGKNDEGRKLFDELLQAQNRASKILHAVAVVLREVGAVSEARKLAEEAFEKEGDPRQRDNIARTRAVIWLDLDDRIAWLNKIQSQDRMTKAEICSARGEKSLSENRDADAEKDLREAIEHYAALPETAVTLNNSALNYFSLYRLNGDDKELQRGITNLEKAVALLPRDSILLSNAADNLLANSVRGILGNRLDWKVLKLNGSLDLLAYFYHDQATKDDLRAQMRRHEGMVKARAYYERLSVIAPKNAHSYGALNFLYGFLQEGDALRRLEERLKKAELDQADTIRISKDFYEGKQIEQHVQDMQHAVDFEKKRLAEARKVGGATLAVAAGKLLRDWSGLATLDRLAPADESVKLAEEAQRAAPSRGAQGLLIEALLQRAHQQLSAQQPEYADLAKQCRRSLGAYYLIALVLDGEANAVQKACLADADVQRVLALVKETNATYDDEFSEWTWAMLHHTDPDWTKAKLKHWQANERSRVGREIARQLTPYSASDVCRQFWVLRMQGKDEEAHALLRRSVEQGIPLPRPKKQG